MKLDPQKHQRRSIRLKDYDYPEAGAYFVTICAQNHRCLFGNIVNGQTKLSSIGKIVQNEWNSMPIRFPNVELDEFIIMPNHIPCILIVGAIRRGGLPMIKGQAQGLPLHWEKLLVHLNHVVFVNAYKIA